MEENSKTAHMPQNEQELEDWKAKRLAAEMATLKRRGRVTTIGAFILATLTIGALSLVLYWYTNFFDGRSLAGGLFFFIVFTIVAFAFLEPKKKDNWITKRFFTAYTADPYEEFLEGLLVSGLLSPASDRVTLLDSNKRVEEMKRLAEEQKRLNAEISDISKFTAQIFEPKIIKLKQAVIDEEAARDNKIKQETEVQTASLGNNERHQSVLKLFAPM